LRLKIGFASVIWACASVLAVAGPPAERATAIFAGGCFWCEETAFEGLPGVFSVVSGYTGGQKKNPTYEEVSAGSTGHAESVEVTYDPSKITYEKLLDVFWHNVDPTQGNGQFCDHGTQYRSAIFYNTPQQQQVAESYIKQLTAAKTFSRPIVTQVAKLSAFYPAEEYHQDYLAHHPNQLYIVINDQPKVAALKKQFPTEYRD
jgi:methionine-S-sulfoxide reductase